MGLSSQEVCCFPSNCQPVYSPQALLAFIQVNASLHKPIILIAYSAGNVGAIGAARAWTQLGGVVKVLIAIDAWAVPLSGNCPIVTLCHDQFTDFWVRGFSPVSASFYADPPTSHQQLWQAPERVWGVSCPVSPYRSRTTAAQFIQEILLTFCDQPD